MTQATFTMHTQKQGRIKYLLLTVGLPILMMQLCMWLVEYGVLPTGKILSMIYVYLPVLMIGVLGYFLIIKKNHRIDVEDNTIIETDWRRRKACRIKPSQIHSVRRNFLKEVILLDQDGKRLLCVEANMSNFDQFEQWLEGHTR